MISNSPLGGTAPTFPGSDQLYLGIQRSGVSRWWCAVGQIPKQGLVSCQTLRSVSGRDVRSGGGVRIQDRTDCRIPAEEPASGSPKPRCCLDLDPEPDQEEVLSMMSGDGKSQDKWERRDGCGDRKAVNYGCTGRGRLMLPGGTALISPGKILGSGSEGHLRTQASALSRTGKPALNV